MIPVVELLRVSTEYQADEARAGLPAQHAANLRTCEAFGLAPIACVEIVEGGDEVASSEEMLRTLSMIEAGAARGIVLAEYSRLFRPDRWSDLIVLQKLSDHHAHIYLPSGPIDLQSEIGFVQATVNNLLAAMERRRIRERMDRGKEEHRRRGAHVAGGIGLPLGLAYNRESGWTYTPDIERVREAFRLFLAGERRLSAISDAVGMARSSVKYVLQNPVYSGWRVYDTRRDPSAAGRRPGSKDRRKLPRAVPDVIRVRLPLEPVVSEADFALVQAVLKELETSRTPRGSWDGAFTYRGFLQCAHDDQPIYGTQKRMRGVAHFQYVCRSRIPGRRPAGVEPCEGGWMVRDRLHDVLDQVVTDRLTDVDLLTTAVEEYSRSQADAWRRSEPDRAALQRQAEALRARRERVLELFIDGVIDRAQRDERLAPIAGELAALERLLVAAPAPPAPAVTAELLGGIVGAFAEWAFLSQPAKRRVLEALNPTFFVSRYQVEGVRFPLAPVDGGRRYTDSHSPAAGAAPRARSVGTPAVHRGTARRCAPATPHRDAAGCRRRPGLRPRPCGAGPGTVATIPVPDRAAACRPRSAPSWPRWPPRRRAAAGCPGGAARAWTCPSRAARS